MASHSQETRWSYGDLGGSWLTSLPTMANRIPAVMSDSEKFAVLCHFREKRPDSETTVWRGLNGRVMPRLRPPNPQHGTSISSTQVCCVRATTN